MSNKSNRTSATDTTVADLSEQIAILRDDMGALTSTLADLMDAKKEQISEAAQERVQEAKMAAKAKADEAVRQAANAHEYMDEMVTRHPAASLAAAAGVGFLVGMLSSRK